VAALILINRVEERLRSRLADLAAEEPEEDLGDFLAAAVDTGGVAELLTVVTNVSPQWQPKIDRVVEGLSPQRLQALMHAAVTGPEPARLAGLTLIGRAGAPVKTLLADLTAQEPEKDLDEFFATAIRHDAVGDLLATLTHMSRSALDKAVRLPVLNDPAVLGHLERAAAERGVAPELLPILHMVPAMKDRSRGAPS
jgi:hypothetical protein